MISIRTGLQRIGALVALLFIPCACSGAAGARTAAATASTLQVTGTAEQFTVVADGADVRTALSLVFGQAGKQFTVDNDVTGQVTLRLTDQKLAGVLGAICRQALLRYTEDPDTHVYQFSQDDAAVRAAIARIRTLDDAAAAQLRMLGIGPVAGLGAGTGAISPADAFGGSMFKYRATAAEPGELRNGLRVLLPDQAAGARAAARPAAAAPQADSLGSVQLAQVPPQDRMVSLRVPSDHPEPMTTVLLDLAHQSGVPIRVDPAVPTGSVFRFAGNIPSRPLPEVLNLLAPYAHLQWYWAGDGIFITTSPSFQIFFGDSHQPKAWYGVPPLIPAAKQK